MSEWRLGLKEAVEKLPELGRSWLTFLRHPRAFVREGNVEHVHVKEYLAWTIAASALLWSLYSIGRGSPLERVRKAEQILPAVQVDEQVHHDEVNKEGKPEIERVVFLRPGFGLQVTMEGKDPSEPQRALFQLGMGQVLVKNLVISELGETVITTLLLSLYTLSCVLCLHPAARMLRGCASLSQAFRLAFIMSASLWLLSAIMVTAGCVLFVDILALHGWLFLGCWMAIVAIPVFVMTFRCFFSSFSELYQISKKRLLVVGVMGSAVSSLIFPIFFLPLLYVILRFQELWKAIL